MVGMSENQADTSVPTTIDLPLDAPVLQCLASLRTAQPDLARRYAVRLFGIFGSYARNTQRSDSDIDVLVSFTETPTLIDFIRLEDELSVLLGAQVDLVLGNELKPRIAQRVAQEVLRL